MLLCQIPDQSFFTVSLFLSVLTCLYPVAAAVSEHTYYNYQLDNSNNQLITKILNLSTRNWKNLVFTLFALSIPTTLLLFKPNFVRQIMDNLFNRNGGNDTGSSSFLNRRRFRFGSKAESAQYKKVMKKGGNIGGLVNDGNTCFMNSVLQSLASSNSLIHFLNDETIESDAKAKELKFTKAFKTLLDNLNAKHFSKNRDYKTNPVLKTMTKTPNKNFLMGYNQEDAQEFFQTILGELESDFKKIHSSESTPNKIEPVLTTTLPSDSVHGIENLGYIGPVYIPSSQIDPNLKDAALKSSRFNLLTPVDGLSAERIGCLQCGEMGGIRYSVISGLSLNLPPDNYNALRLTDLLTKWIEPEIIEGVDCNRCALNSILEYQNNQLETLQAKEKSVSTEKLISLLKVRISEIERELEKPIIDDEIFEKLHTKNMMKKCSKSKQILISRPPPLLAIHINRSVFDPMTYRVRKNGARVVFPLRLDLDPFVAEPADINTDARLPLSKRVKVQESVINAEEDSSSSSLETPESSVNLKEEQELVDSDDLESDDEQDPVANNNNNGNIATSIERQVDDVSGALVYALRSVIVHYGTHNYGHYIAFRRYRGVWWRTSDESIDIVDEDEVLSAPGVFMLFYELDKVSDHDDSNDDDDDDESGSGEEEEYGEKKGVKIVGDSDSDDNDEELASHEEDGDKDEEEEDESGGNEETLATTIANL